MDRPHKNSQSGNSQADSSQAEDSTSQSRADKLEERLIDFAVRIVRLQRVCQKPEQGNTSQDRF
jgi:hypothetical protein